MLRTGIVISCFVLVACHLSKEVTGMVKLAIILRWQCVQTITVILLVVKLLMDIINYHH